MKLYKCTNTLTHSCSYTQYTCTNELTPAFTRALCPQIRSCLLLHAQALSVASGAFCVHQHCCGQVLLEREPGTLQLLSRSSIRQRHLPDARTAQPTGCRFPDKFVHTTHTVTLFDRSVEMNCLWKNNKAHCIVCFIRPADEGTPQRPSQTAGGQIPDVHQGGFMAGMMPPQGPQQSLQGLGISHMQGMSGEDRTTHVQFWC